MTKKQPSIDDIAREFAAIEARDYCLTPVDYDSARYEKKIAWKLKVTRVIRAIIAARVKMTMSDIANGSHKPAPDIKPHEIN